jgi:Transposase, Mutator family
VGRAWAPSRATNSGWGGPRPCPKDYPLVRRTAAWQGRVAHNALEAPVISGFVRGLSTRDRAAALGEVLGPEAALSKSTVIRICPAIKDEFDAWKPGDLAGSSGPSGRPVGGSR